MCTADLFSAIIILNKITASIFQITHIQNSRPLHECSPNILNEGVRSKLVPKVFLLFGIYIEKRRGPENEVAEGLNWTKCIKSELKEKSLDNAHVQLNSALIVFMPWFNVGRFCAIIQWNNFFGYRMMYGKAIWKLGVVEIAKVSTEICSCTPQEGIQCPHWTPSCTGHCVDTDWVIRSGIFWGMYHLERENISQCLLFSYVKGFKKQRWVVCGSGIAKISHKTMELSY